MATMSIGFSVSGLSETFEVVTIKGSEAISRPFRFDITLISTSTTLDPANVVGKKASLILTSQPGTSEELAVPYYGCVSRFEQRHQVGSGASARVYYQAVLEPRLARLANARGSAVFVDNNPDAPTKTVKDVITSVLDRYSVDLSYAFEHLEETKLRKRAFRCQFQESDLDFICRLMESEGMFFYFQYSSNTWDKLIISMQRTVHGDAPRASIRMKSALVTAADDNLLAFICQQSVVPASVVLRDYNYQTADSAGGEIVYTQAVHSAGSGSVVLYGEDITGSTEGSNLGLVRAQELLCRSRQFVGEGSATGMRAGYLVRLKKNSGHHNTTLDDKRYLLTQVTHEAAQSLDSLQAAGDSTNPPATSYSVSLTAIPHDAQVDGKDVQFRPARVTPWPKIHGTINARIDDDGTGLYSGLDAKGRYKVVLPFIDKSNILAGKCSAWIRMASPYSGGYNNVSHGMHFPLHKGAEVLLSFIDGDPDKPVIVGAVPNSANLSMVDNASQSISRIVSAGGSKIEIDDKLHYKRINMIVPTSSISASPGRNDHGVSYLRLGSAAVDTDSSAGSGSPSTASASAFEDSEDKVMVYIAADGDAKIYTKGSLVVATGEDIDFGTTPWELKYGWGSAEANTSANKQVSAGSSVEHSFSDNVERTIGDNETITLGKNREYTYGESYTETIGDNFEWVVGTSESYVGWGDFVTPGKVAVALKTGSSTQKQVPTTLPKLNPGVNSVASLGNSGSGVPRIGGSTWEIAQSWTGAPTELGWTDSQWTKSCKEVNWLDSVTHVQGDSVERVKGKSYSHTVGDSWEKTNGNSESEVHGNSFEKTYGNTTSWQFGTSNEMHLGGTAELFIGGKTELTLATSAALELAALALELSFGTKLTAAFAADIQLKEGAEFKLKQGATFKQQLISVLASTVSLGNWQAKIGSGFELKA